MDQRLELTIDHGLTITNAWRHRQRPGSSDHNPAAKCYAGTASQPREAINLMTPDRLHDRSAPARRLSNQFLSMKSYEHPAPNERSLAVIADVVRAYEARLDRPEGAIVCRFVAEEEPEVFAVIAAETNLTTEELWRYIESQEQAHASMRGRGFAPTQESDHHRKMQSLRDENERV